MQFALLQGSSASVEEMWVCRLLPSTLQDSEELRQKRTRSNGGCNLSVNIQIAFISVHSNQECFGKPFACKEPPLLSLLLLLLLLILWLTKEKLLTWASFAAGCTEESQGMSYGCLLDFYQSKEPCPPCQR